jgi:hypothetical protein
MPSALEVFAQIMNLSVTVMAGGDRIGGTGFYNLIGFETSILPARFRHARLEKSAAAATAVIVGAVRGHIDKIFLPHDFFHHIAKIFGYRISKGFSNKLTWILNGKLNL